MKHTPEVLEVKPVAIEFTDDSKLIGSFDVEFEAESISFPEMKNIAQLYKAAPKLLEALKEIVALMDADDPVEVGCHCTDSGDTTVECAWCKAKAALAKVEGPPVEAKKPTTIGDLIGEDFFK